MVAPVPLTLGQLRELFSANAKMVEQEYDAFLEITIRIKKYISDETIRLRQQAYEPTLKKMMKVALVQEKKRKLNLPTEEEIKKRVNEEIAGKVPHEKELEQASKILDIALRCMITGQLPKHLQIDPTGNQRFRDEADIKTYMTEDFAPIKDPICFGELNRHPYIYTVIGESQTDEELFLHVSNKCYKEYVKQQADTTVMFCNNQENSYTQVGNHKRIEEIRKTFTQGLVEYSGLLALVFYKTLKKVETMIQDSNENQKKVEVRD